MNGVLHQMPVEKWPLLPHIILRRDDFLWQTVSFGLHLSDFLHNLLLLIGLLSLGDSRLMLDHLVLDVDLLGEVLKDGEVAVDAILPGFNHVAVLDGREV